MSAPNQQNAPELLSPYESDPVPHPEPLTTSPGAYSSINRRSTTFTVQRAYPWLLILSTATAALFLAMYLTKPVVIQEQEVIKEEAVQNRPSPQVAKAPISPESLLPEKNTLPGEAAPQQNPPLAETSSPLPSPPVTSIYEETNLRVQHILSAEAPGGHINRIDIDVPVLYQSRNLAWSATEIAEAHKLMLQLMDYQDKTRQLKTEGEQLLVAWNALIGKSIPTASLRADSPSLPENQQLATSPGRLNELETTDAIQLEPSQQ